MKDTLIGKTKLGKGLATRIYKVFLGTKYHESVIDWLYSWVYQYAYKFL